MRSLVLELVRSLAWVVPIGRRQIGMGPEQLMVRRKAASWLGMERVVMATGMCSFGPVQLGQVRSSVLLGKLVERRQVVRGRMMAVVVVDHRAMELEGCRRILERST